LISTKLFSMRRKFPRLLTLQPGLITKERSQSCV
jgi:hypothetical protein